MERGLRERLHGFTRPMSARRATTAIAVAIVLAIAGGAALIAVRHGQMETSPTARASASFDFETGGWGWRRVGNPAPGMIGLVPSGLVGECVVDGLPAICTSKDAVSWSTQPDPSIVATAGAVPFHGWSVAHGGSAWVATSGIDAGVWHSSDGLHWSESDVGVPGLEHARVQAWGAGVALLGVASDGATSGPVLLRSSDGVSWTAVSLPAGASNPQFAGAIGVVVGKPGLNEGAVELSASADGSSWAPLALPGGMSDLMSTVRVPGGGFAGVASSITVGDRTLVTSADGRSWAAASGIATPIYSIAPVGNRLLAIAQVASTDLVGLYESPDGASWTRFALIGGSPLQGSVLVSLGDRVALYDGSRLVAVGSPLPAGWTSPTPSPSPSAGTPTPSAGDTAAATFISGGWRWHELNLSPGEWVVRLPTGYLGRCGDSMCTSPNGWTWQTPPEPAIFATDGPALFTPFNVSRRPGGGNYVLAAAEGLWYSADGVRWQPSGGSNLTEATVLAGPEGFAAIALVEAESSERLFLSDDGVTWSRAPKNMDHYFFLQGHGDTSAGIVGGVEGKTAYMYSKDGRQWTPAHVPTGAFGWAIPARLADGSLLAAPGGELLLRSKDGLSWTKVQASWQPTYMATEGDRVLVVGSHGDRVGLLFESTDSARTFHQIMDGVTALGQWGDLAMIQTAGGTFVGTPLAADELAATTLSPEKPAVSQAPAWTPEPTPTGGISKAEAIRIAVAAAQVPAAEAATATAGLTRGYGLVAFGRWVWEVSFTEYNGGPLNAQGISVDVDYYTGEVLSVGRWIS